MPRQPKQEQQELQFAGFQRPESNYFKMPNDWIDLTAEINNVAELKVVQYILRHTWGYQEYDIKKHITIDEFSHGRRRSDGSRMDKGTGLSERAVRYGLQAAVGHKLIEELVDDSDRGRTKKFYSLRMSPDSLSSADRQDLHSGVQSLHLGVQSLPPRGAQIAPRSEKDTKERNIKNSNVRKTSLPKKTDSETSPTLDPQPNIRRAPASPESIGIESANGSRTQPPPPRPTYDEDRDRILAYLQDISRLLNDQAPLQSSVTRAYHLYQQAGKPIEVFCEALYQARAITQEHSAAIRGSGTVRGSGLSRKSKMAYFFRVLEDVLGLKPMEPPGSDTTYPTG